MPEPLLVLRGERVALGVLDRELAPTFARWSTDLAYRQGGADARLRDAESEGQWIADRAEESRQRRPPQTTFVVHDLADLAPVGFTTLMDTDYRHGTAVFGIGLGERRRRGLGREATRLTLDWAFHIAGLHNVMLETAVWNETAIRAYVAAGFQEVGRRRGATVEWGRRWDILIMDAVAEGFDSPVLGKLSPGAG
jgi:diamine N-acetyltransferase